MLGGCVTVGNLGCGYGGCRGGWGAKSSAAGRPCGKDVGQEGCDQPGLLSSGLFSKLCGNDRKTKRRVAIAKLGILIFFGADSVVFGNL